MKPPPEDYPRTAQEFQERFRTEEACWGYLVALRWPGGFRCPGCGSAKAWLILGRLFECQPCHRQVSVTAGTIFQDTRKPLRLWFQVMWWVVGQKLGASALGLNRVLDIGVYQTAWSWLHKIRRAMVRPGRESLAGEVEVDETYVGGKAPGKRGRGSANKALVAIAAQVDGQGIGRIRMRRIPDATPGSLLPFVTESIQAGSTVITDGWKSYNPLKEAGYKHKIHVLSRSTKTASRLLPRVHRVASLLKRWLLGTHQGAVARQHLDYYLDEFTFRFNRRTSRHRGKLFFRLLQQAVNVHPAPYHTLIKGIRGRPSRKHKR